MAEQAHSSRLDIVPIAADSLVAGPDAVRLLVECAQLNVPVQIGFPTSSYTCTATCSEYKDGRLSLTLDKHADPAALSIFALCSVYIGHGRMAYLGLGRLLAIQPGARGEVRIEIDAPGAFSTAEPRTSERITVPAGCGLRTFVYHEGVLHRAKPVNVSLGGMLVELASPLESVDVGSVVQVQASWDGISTTLPALVRWCEGGSYGLFFNTVAQFGQPSSCPQLVSIVQKLLMYEPAQVAA